MNKQGIGYNQQGSLDDKQAKQAATHNFGFEILKMHPDTECQRKYNCHKWMLIIVHEIHTD